MGYDLEGKLHKKFDTEQKTATFKSRDIVVEIAGQYPQLIKLQFAQDRCELVDNISEGTPVKVWFDLRGKEHQGKYFTNLNAWRIEPTGARPEPTSTGVNGYGQPANDNLPF
jgi:hypothetical protein